MNYVLSILLALGMAAAVPPRKPVPQPVVVLELFTSQGCSSCPPADNVLRTITEQARQSGKAVFGLSFHVDYWNRLGWQDPFSSKQFTDRQRQYDRTLHAQTYTPQLIVNGRQDIIGGQRGQIESAIQTVRQQPASAFIGVDGQVIHNDRQVTVDYVLSAGGPYRINVALVQKVTQTAVRTGENGGRTLTNTNVVRQFTTLDGSTASGRTTLTLPAGLTPDQTNILLYVQRQDNGQVVGATLL